MKRELWGLAGWLAVTFLAAAFGSLFTPGPDYWALRKPAFNPPAWVFGPVWTVLYVLMATAAWLVWKRRGFQGAPGALGLYLAQLFLNALWSYIFFGLQWRGVAFFELLLLWALILLTLRAFRRAGGTLPWVLLTPYLLWVTFAGVLNYALSRMNEG